MTFPAMSIVTGEEPMLVEVGSCLCTDACSQPINEVRGKHGVDWAYIYLAGMVQIARFNKVFYQCFCPEYDVFEAFQLLYSVNECLHFSLTLSEFHRAILVPEGFIAHHCIGFPPCRSLAFEELFGQFVKGIIA